MRIGIVTVSDRASRGEYQDLGGPAIADYLTGIVSTPWTPVARVIPDGRESVRDTLIQLCDAESCGLVLVTGGTGPSPRDETPEGIMDVIDKELAGFGELMRRVSLEQVPTAILSRQLAGIRGRSLIIAVPGKPAAIAVCLNAVFPAVPYCLQLIEAGRLDTHADKIKAFRPA
jgi:molybdopterin adenylyltransferase